MSAASRLFLVLGCLVLTAIELPHGAALLADDLPGPYGPVIAAQARGASETSFDEVSALGDEPGADVEATRESDVEDAGEITARR